MLAFTIGLIGNYIFVLGHLITDFCALMIEFCIRSAYMMYLLLKWLYPCLLKITFLNMC